MSVQSIGKARLLWLTEWNDGPSAGVLLYEGRYCTFRVSIQTESGLRRFTVRDLTWEALQRELAIHRLYEQNVSTLYCYHNGLERKNGDKDNISRYYTEMRWMPLAALPKEPLGEIEERDLMTYPEDPLPWPA